MNSIYADKLQRYGVLVEVKVNAPSADDANLAVQCVLSQGNADVVIAGVPKAERNLCADFKKTTFKGAPKFPQG